MILFSVKLEIFPYYLLDKAHLTQGHIFTRCSLLCFVLQRSELWADNCGNQIAASGKSGLGDHRHPGIQASGRKGKPDWVSFSTLWFSFRVTTDEVQTLLFTALLNTFYFGFLGWLEPCFSWGTHLFQLF